MKYIFLLTFIFSIFLISCGEDPKTENKDLCQGVICSNHGECKELEGAPTCECDEGYIANGLTCIESQQNLCEGVVCDDWEECNSETGNCDLKSNRCNSDQNCLETEQCNTTAHICEAKNLCEGVYCDDWKECNSNTGSCDLKEGRCETVEHCYTDEICDQNHNCVNELTPCDNQNCSNHGVCEVQNSQAVCICEEGYHQDGLNCIQDSLCNGVICDEWRECSEESGECLLKDGRCDSDTNCDNGYICEQSTHLCVEDSICNGVTCDEWRECNIDTGICELKEERCENNTHCDQNLSCDLSTHLCVEEGDLCQDITCSGHGVCSISSQQAKCNCEHGYRADGLTCIVDVDIANWCIIQWPTSLFSYAGTEETEVVYGQIYSDGLTSNSSEQSTIKAQLGYISRDITYPIITDSYNWIDANFNVSGAGDYGNNHEYMAYFPNSEAGDFNYIYRFSINSGATWIYCDLDGVIESSSINSGTAEISGELLNNPKLELVSQPTISSDGYSFSVKYTAGETGADIDLSESIITLNGDIINLSNSYNSESNSFTISTTGLNSGKYTYLFKVKDQNGNSAKYLFVPIWVESTPFEWKDAFLYQIMTDRFLDGDSNNNSSANDNSDNSVEWKADWQGGDFRGIIEKIDSGYFTDMGVNAIWISSPIINTQGAGKGMGDDPHYYAGYHSYWPIATGWTDTVSLSGLSSAIEPHFGTAEELKELVQKAHAKNIRVVVDFVANHIHTDSPLWTQYSSENWFHSAPSGKPENSNGGYNCGWEEPIVCWFTDYLPDFNYSNRDVMNAVIDHAIWMVQEFDIDGFRLDAVKHMVMEFSTTIRSRIENEVVTTGIPFYMVGETFTGDAEFDTIGAFLGSDKLDGQFDFPLFYHISRTFLLQTESLEDFNDFVFANDNRYQTYYYSNSLMSNFFGNHDISRAISVANGDFDGTPQGGSVAHDRAWDNEPTIPTDPFPYQKLRMAQTFLLTSPGIPLIYQGDEFGMPGAHDPDNRRGMIFGSDLSAHQAETLNHVKLLGTFRSQHPAVRKGVRTEHWKDPNFWVYSMKLDNDIVIVAFNRNSFEVTNSVIVSQTGLTSGTMQDLLGNAPINIVDGSAEIVLPAYSSAVYYLPTK